MVDFIIQQAEDTPEEIENAERDMLNALHQCAEGTKKILMSHAQTAMMLFETAGVDNLGLYYLSLIQKALANISAFEALILAKNYSVALALLRMQIDVYLKINLIMLVSNPEALAKHILEDKPLKDYKDKKFPNGIKDTTIYYRMDKKRKDKWTSSMYRETSKYVHPSRRDAEQIIKNIDIINGSRLQKYTFFIEQNGYIPITVGYLWNIIKEFKEICHSIVDAFQESSNYLRDGILKQIREDIANDQ